MDTSKNLLGIAEVARSLPESVSPSTVWRWITKGCRGVRLAAVRFGNRYYVAPADLEAFGRELSSKSVRDMDNSSWPRPSQPVRRTSRQREAEIEAAEKELDAAGI